MVDDSDETVGRTFAANGDEPDEDEGGYEDEYDDEEEGYDEDELVETAEDDLGDGFPAAHGPAGSPQDNLRHLVHFLATNLVDDPEGVVVEAEQRGQTVSITLRVPEEELGKVIGRQGRIARAIRTVLTIAGSRQNVRASLDIEG